MEVSNHTNEVAREAAMRHHPDIEPRVWEGVVNEVRVESRSTETEFFVSQLMFEPFPNSLKTLLKLSRRQRLVLLPHNFHSVLCLSNVLL